jgi:ribosomal protein L37AE/L43A
MPWIKVDGVDVHVTYGKDGKATDKDIETIRDVIKLLKETKRCLHPEDKVWQRPSGKWFCKDCGQTLEGYVHVNPYSHLR